MIAELTNIFKNLGFKPLEARVYVAVLNMKDGGFSYEIAETTKIKRTSCDLIISRLLERGVLTKAKDGKRSRYKAIPPETLLFQQEQLTDSLKAAIPLLQKMKASEAETEVRFFEGPDAIRQMYDDLFLSLRVSDDKEILNISSGQHVRKYLPGGDSYIVSRREKYMFPIRIIAPRTAADEKGWQNDERTKRSVRYFDDPKKQFQISFYLYADKVLIYSPLPPVGGIILRNVRINQSLRLVYEMLWGFHAPD